MKKTGLIMVFLLISTPFLLADDAKPPLFEIEFSVGFTSANPNDLNLITRSEELFNSFYLNQSYTYLQNIGYINSYTRTINSEYAKLKHTTPLDIRLKTRISPSLSLSLGIKYFNNKKSFNLVEEFLVEENSGNESSDIVQYSPFELEVKAYVVSVGVHYGIDLGRKFRIEGFLAAGPMFGECAFYYAHFHNLHYGDTDIDIDSEMSLRVRGEGTSTAFEGGAQFQFRLNKRLAFFVSSGYTKQVIHKLSGPGVQEMYGFTQEWQGVLGIKEATFGKPWGTTTIRWPSNFWEGEEFLKQRDMKLDLSGYQIKFGLILGI